MMRKTTILLTALFSAAVFAQEQPAAVNSAGAILEQPDAVLLPDDGINTPDNPVHAADPVRMPGDAAHAPAADSPPEPLYREPRPADSAAQTKIEPAGEPAPESVPAIIPEPAEEPPAPPRQQKPKREPQMYVPSPLSSAWVFPAGYVSCNMRDGYRKFDGIDDYLHVPRNTIFMYGGVAGKRFALKNPRLRVQTVLEFGWGTSEENSFNAMYSDGIIRKTGEYIHLFTMGALTDMHVLFPTQYSNRMFFLSVGPGVHRTAFRHNWKLENGREVVATNELKVASLSANIGAGMEYRISRHRAVSVSYGLRIWEPVYYTDIGDMFPMGTRYNEVFLSHSLMVQILLPSPWVVGFR